jgi:DNA polymerase V
MLSGIVPKNQVQINLFNSDYHFNRNDKVMNVFDKLTQELGSGAVWFGSSGTKRTWKSKSERRSKRYTTKWNELKSVE